MQWFQLTVKQAFRAGQQKSVEDDILVELHYINSDQLYCK